MNLKKKNILITGASSGIGQATAVACAEKGATIFIHYHNNILGAEQTLKEVERCSKAYMFQADLTKENEIEKMFKEIINEFKEIDILINNAGTGRPGDFFDVERWKEQFDNIFFSALIVSQFFLKQKNNSSLKKILNISSCYGNSSEGEPSLIAYSVAKAALSSMTILLAKTSGNTLVNAIAPGYTLTQRWKKTSETTRNIYESKTKIGRFIQPVEIAQFVASVLENDAITGQVLTIDGGLSLH